MATILVVDDRSYNRDLLTTLLGYAGHRLLEAASAPEGLALARTEHPDLIITDIVMPAMDGYEFARVVRADAVLHQTRVVFYTSSYVIAETRRLADACGVTHIIAKPAEPEDILQTVNQALAAPPQPAAPPPTAAFHEEHMRLLTDKLAAKVDELEAENAERRRAEQTLRLQSAALNAAANGIVITDRNGTIEWINPAVTAMTGYTLAEAVGKNPRELFKSGAQSPQVYRDLWDTVLAGQVWQGELINRRKDGSQYIEEQTITPVRAADGSLSHFIAVKQDITARKQAEAALAESEDKFKYIFDYSVVGKSITTPAGGLSVNQAFSDMVGYTPAELQDYAWNQITHPDDIAASRAIMTSILAGERDSARWTKRYIHKSGAIVWAELNTSLRRDAHGQPLYFITTVSDITARKQAEELLRESEAHLRTLFENAPISIWEEDCSAVKAYLDQLPSDPAHLDEYLSAHPEVVEAGIPLVQVIDVNQPTLALLDVPDKNALLGPLRVTQSPESHLAFQRELVAMARGETRLQGDTLVITHTGQRRDVSMDWAVVPGHEHDYSRVLLTMVDITERKRAQEEIARTNELLSRAEQIGHIGSFARDLASNRATWSDGLYQLFGLDKEKSEITLQEVLALVHPDDREPARESVERALREGGRFELENRIVRADGQVRVVSTQGETVFDAQGQPAQLLGLMRDITERRQAEDAQRASEQRYRLLFEQNPMPMWVYDVDSLAFVAVNEAAVAHYGYSQAEFLAMGVADIRPPEEMDRLRADLAAGRLPLERSGLWKHRKKDGTLIDVEVVSHEASFIGHSARLVLANDVTERRRAEALVQRQLARLAALRSIDMAISASLDLRLTLQIVLDQVMTELQVDAADVYLVNANLHAIEFAAGRGLPAHSGRPAQMRWGQGLAGQVARERQMLAVPDARLAPAAVAGTAGAAGLASAGFQAYYGLPLIAKGVVTGVLEVFQRQPLPANPDWLDFLEALAGQAAIAIDNAGMFGDLQQSNQNLSLAYDATIEGWSRALDLRDHETEGHSQRVTEMTLRLAEQMGVAPAQLVNIRRGALLHDIGKMGVPDNVLQKPGPLSDDEWVSMRQHPVYAYNLLSPIQYLQAALEIPYCHHEKWDGSGYPRQLKGEAIPLAARIFAVVDVWDALLSDRPYRRGWPQAAVRDHIRAGAGQHFDPAVVAAFDKLMDEEP